MDTVKEQRTDAASPAGATSAKGSLLRHERLCCALAILCLWALWGTYKLSLVKGSPRYHAETEVGFFYSESAIHYRLYEIIGDPANDWETVWAILQLDRKAQWPEGLPVLRELPFGMEMFYGLLHRWLAPTSAPHVFLLNAIAAYGGLALACVFWIGLRVTGSRWWGVFGSALYATLEWSFVRTVRGAFYYEDFAMPFLLGAIALMLPARGATGRSRPVATGILAGLLAACAAAFWHVSQYPLAATLGVLSLRTACGKLAGEDRFAPALVAGFAAGSLLFPVLRAKVFLLSLPMAAAIQWSLWARLGSPRLLPRRLMAWGMTLVALVLAVSLLNPRSKDYSHVFEYVLARLRFIAGPPEDPTAMGFVARAFWEGPFLWASGEEIVHGLRGALLVLPLVFVPLVGPLRGRWTAVVTSCLTLFFLAMGVGMRRFLILAAPFCAVSIAVGFSIVTGWLRAALRHAKYLRVWQYAAVALLCFNVLTLPRTARGKRFPPPDCYWPVTEWLSSNSGEDEAFFCRMASSAVILQGTNRPSVVQPIWESKWARVKYEELTTTAFADEETFWRSLRKYDTSYFVYDFNYVLGSGPRSEAYMAGLVPPLGADVAVVCCHFHPKALRYLDLVYQDNAFRVFRLRDAEARVDDQDRLAAIAEIVDNCYSPIYDPANFPSALGGDDALECALRVKESLACLARGERALQGGDTEGAEEHLLQAISRCPNNLGAHGNLALLSLAQGNVDKALEHLRRCREIAPRNRYVTDLGTRIQQATAKASDSDPMDSQPAGSD